MPAVFSEVSNRAGCASRGGSIADIAEAYVLRTWPAGVADSDGVGRAFCAYDLRASIVEGLAFGAAGYYIIAEIADFSVVLSVSSNGTAITGRI